VAQVLLPDRPVAFGYKQVWLAIRDTKPPVVAETLGLLHTRASTWKEGIERAYEQGYDRERRRYRDLQEIFVSPPVLDWTLAVGGIGALPEPGMGDWTPWLCNLSQILGHVQFFGTHRVSSVVAWAKAERGRIVRAYCNAGGETLISEGHPTPEEVMLGFDFLDETRATPAEIIAHRAKVDAEMARWEMLMIELEALRAKAEARGERFDEGILDDERYAYRYNLLIPGEDSVMMLAGRWSLDPQQLEEHQIEPGLGLLGKIARREYP
jgi:hypothetical protein